MRQRTKRRSLRLETLENRQLMAGDVVAAVNNGTLIITGDAADNAVILSKDPASAGVLVSGIPDVNAASTTINGHAPDSNTGISSQVFANVKNVVLDLKGGSDTLGVSGLTLNGVSIVMDDSGDSGNDNVLIGGTLDNPPASYDPTRIPPAVADFLQSPVTINGALSILTGSGDDVVTESDLTLMGAEIVSTGAGNDQVFLGTFTDASNVAHGVSARGALLISTAAGNDEVQIAGAQVRGATAITTGDDSDAVTIHDSSFGVLAVHLGNGTDTLTLGNTTALATALDGGAGSDTFVDAGGNQLGFSRRINFE